jgi:hypothetical protein
MGHPPPRRALRAGIRLRPPLRGAGGGDRRPIRASFRPGAGTLLDCGAAGGDRRLGIPGTQDQDRGQAALAAGGAPRPRARHRRATGCRDHPLRARLVTASSRYGRKASSMPHGSSTRARDSSMSASTGTRVSASDWWPRPGSSRCSTRSGKARLRARCAGANPLPPGRACWRPARPGRSLRRDQTAAPARRSGARWRHATARRAPRAIRPARGRGSGS